MPGDDFLAREIATYERERGRLEAEHKSEFVLIQADQVAGTFSSLDEAAAAGLQRFAAEPFMIRRIAEDKVKLSVAVLYGLTHAGDPVHLSVR